MQESQTKTHNPLSIGRIAMMAVLSIILVCSVYFTAFTPYPLGLAIILYGRKVGFSVISLAIVAFYLITANYIQDYSVFAVYLLSAFMGVTIGEIILRKINPIKGMVVTITSLLLVFGGAYLSQKSAIDASIKAAMIEKVKTLEPVFKSQIEELKSSPDGSPYALQSIFENPEPFIDEAIATAPGYIIMAFILMMWVNTFLLLKSQRLVQEGSANQKVSEIALLNFKMPDHFIFPVLAGLAMYMWGEEYKPWVTQVGLLILQILGVFYFFQGFGIYNAYLNYYKIRGFLRSVLMVLTVLIAYQMIALIGLFDMFVNFRKYLKKRDSES